MVISSKPCLMTTGYYPRTRYHGYCHHCKSPFYRFFVSHENWFFFWEFPVRNSTPIYGKPPKSPISMIVTIVNQYVLDFSPIKSPISHLNHSKSMKFSTGRLVITHWSKAIFHCKRPIWSRSVLIRSLSIAWWRAAISYWCLRSAPYVDVVLDGDFIGILLGFWQI